MTGLVRRVRAYVKHHGLVYTLQRCGEKAAERVFRFYDRTWRQLAPTQAELDAQRAHPIDAGLISVVVPVYNTNPVMLREMADSLLAQTYSHWEAILFDDCSPSEETRAALEAVAALDERIRVHRGEKNQGISGSSNCAVALAQGEWIALMDHDDLLTPDALYVVAQTILEKQPDLVYSDEDKITENGKRHTDPHFKPDYSPDNLCSVNYICHLMVMRKSLLMEAGGFRTAFNGSQDHDLALRCVERTERIVHIPKVLYHWRTVNSSVSHQNLMKCVNAACTAVQEHMERIGWPGRAEPQGGNIRLKYDIKGHPVVGVYIFGEDDAALERCEAAIQGDKWTDKVIHMVRIGQKGRYAAMNQAAESAAEDVLLMLDASVTPTDDAFITELLMYAQRDDVGAVTPKLINSKRLVAHAGFVVSMEGIAQCRQPRVPEHIGGWHLMMQKSHNVAAVSAMCFTIRKDHFVAFDTAYQGGLGAVDWSLRLNGAGFRHVFTPYAVAWCENKDWLLLGKKRNEKDAARFAAHWKDIKDPYYSDLFAREKANYKLRKDYDYLHEQVR